MDYEETEQSIVVDGEVDPTTLEIVDNVKRMCELQDRIKELAAKRKELNDEIKEIQPMVQEYMVDNKIRKFNYKTDEIFVNKRTANGPLSKAALRQALEDFHGEDGEGAEDCFNYIIESLGTKEVVELKRRKRKEPKKPKPKKTAIKRPRTSQFAITDGSSLDIQEM